MAFLRHHLEDSLEEHRRQDSLELEEEGLLEGLRWALEDHHLDLEDRQEARPVACLLVSRVDRQDRVVEDSRRKALVVVRRANDSATRVQNDVPSYSGILETRNDNTVDRIGRSQEANDLLLLQNVAMLDERRRSNFPKTLLAHALQSHRLVNLSSHASDV